MCRTRPVTGGAPPRATDHRGPPPLLGCRRRLVGVVFCLLLLVGCEEVRGIEDTVVPGWPRDAEVEREILSSKGGGDADPVSPLDELRLRRKWLGEGLESLGTVESKLDNSLRKATKISGAVAGGVGGAALLSQLLASKYLKEARDAPLGDSEFLREVSGKDAAAAAIRKRCDEQDARVTKGAVGTGVAAALGFLATSALVLAVFSALRRRSVRRTGAVVREQLRKRQSQLQRAIEKMEAQERKVLAVEEGSG